jgi:hypothetical protein
MVQLGLPPGYCCLEGDDEELAPANEDEGMDVVLGSESEDEGRHGLNYDLKKQTPGDMAGEAMNGTEDTAAAEGQHEENGGGEIDEGAMKVDNGLAGGLPGVGQAVWDNLKKLSQNLQGHDGGPVQETPGEGNALSTPAGVNGGQVGLVANRSLRPASRVVCRVKIPGLNAPIPEGAEKHAWELDMGMAASTYA